MTFNLPSSPAPNGATPKLRDFGTILTPFLGGPEQRINRLGTRFALEVTMPPLPSGDSGRLFVSRLLQARQSRLIMKWPLLSFDPGDPGTPLIRVASTSGSTIYIKGLSAGYQIKEGQFFSIISGGQRYMYMSPTDQTADGSGDLDASIFPMLRVSTSIDDVLEISQPMIEGHVSPGDEISWQMALDHNLDISFEISESA